MSPDLHHLSAAYALDALDPAERAAFEAHYPSCEICSADVDLDREVAALLADAVAHEPPAGLKASVMVEIDRTRQISPLVPTREPDLGERRRRRSRQAAWLTAVAATVVAAVGIISLVRPDPGSDVADVVAAPDAIVTALDGTGGSLRVVWSPERREVAVFGNDLDDPGPGLAYALWVVLDDGSVTPAGLFSPADAGTVRTVLATDDAEAAGWGVTIEPETGSDQPTTEVIYLGDV